MFKQLPTTISGLSQLGTAVNKLKSLNFSAVGLNAANIDVYRSAVASLSQEQATLALSSQGLNQAQIALVLSNKQVTASEIEEAAASASAASTKSILTAAQQQELVSSRLLTTEKLSEIATTLGLETAEDGSLVAKKALNAEMVKQQLTSLGIVGTTQMQVLSMLGLTTAEASATTATGVLSGVMTTLNAVMAAIPIGGILTVASLAATAIWGLSKAFEALTDSVEEVEKRTDALIEKYNTAKTKADGNASTVESLASEYKELSKGVNNLGENISLTSDEYDRYNEIVNQIAEMFPNLVTGYTEEGNAILSLKGNVESLRDAYKEAQQEAYNLLIVSGEDSNGNDIIANYQNQVNGNEPFLSKTSSFIDGEGGAKDAIDIITRLTGALTPDEFRETYDQLYEEYKNIWNSDKIQDALKSSGFEGLADKWQSFTEDDLAKVKYTAQATIQTYKAEIDSQLKKIDILANAYLLTNEDYSKLGEQSKTVASLIVNSITEDIANGFSSKEDVGAYIANIVSLLKDNPDIDDAMIRLFTTDFTDMSTSEAQGIIDQYINTIAEKLNEDPVELKVRLGFDDYDDIEPLKNKVQGFLKDEFDSRVNELSLEDLNIASNLEIPDGTLLSWDQLIAKIKEAKEATSDTTVLSSTEFLAQVQKLSEGLDQLDAIYADVYDKKDFDWSSILNNDSFTEAFGQLGDAYTNFIETISNSPSDIEACQSAFDDLATAYIYNSDVLDNVTEATKDATIAMLEQMGIENAAELVTNSLAQNENYLAAQKILVANATFDLANATAAEIDSLAQENNMTETTKQQIALLALQKQLCNQTSIMTDGDIKNLQALAEQAGATQTAIAAIKLTNQKIETAGSGRRYSNNPEDAKKLWQKTYDDIYASISNKAQLKNVGGTSNSGISTNSGYKPSYTGGTKTKSAKDSASSGSGSSSSDSSEAEDNYEETIDFFEQRVKVLQQALDFLDKSLENVLGSDRKNQLLSAQSDIVSEEMRNYTDALSMYQAKANEALSKIDSSLRDKVVNGAVAITDFIGEGNEDTVEAIQDYQNWAEKIGDCKEQLAELAQQLREIELSKFNNIVEEFTTKTDFFTDANSNIQKQIDLFEKAGQIIGEGFYDAQKQNSQKQLNLLEEEKSRLVQQLNNSLSSGKIQQGTDEWVEMVNTLSDLDGSILDCKKSIEEMDDAILNLHTEQFERIQTAFSNIKTELEDIYDLIGDSDDVALDDGTWTSAGITKIGLLAQQYETAKLQAQRYGEEIDQLNSDYLAGKYSATEYAEKLASLTQSQYDSLKAAESIKDSIVDINQSRVDIMTDAINKETEAYNELIQAKKDALSSEQDLYEYRKNISEKTKSITDIERQLAALANDNSSSAKAQKAKLKNQLEEAKQDLTDYEYEQDIKNRQDALDKEQEAYEKSQQERIDALNAYLENRNQVISDSFETVKANTSVVADQLTQIAQTHGVNISNVITSAWAQGSNAIASYGNVLSAQSSVFLGNLLNVQSGIYALNVEANNTANALGYMFSTSASTLLSQLQSSYNSIGNVNITTQALRDSLVNTLERGYDVSSISNGLNSITDSANSATSAVNNLKNALGGSSSPNTSSSSSSGTSSKASSSANNALSNSNRKDYYVYTQDGSYVRSNLTATQAFTTLMDKRKTELASITRLLPSKYEIGKYAQGGMVSKSKNNPLNSLAQLLGEDTMIAAKEGESVLTPEQTANLKALAENGENWLKAVSIDTSRFFTNSAPLNISKIQTEQPINISVDKFVEVQGSIDSATMPQVNAAIKKSINDLGTKLNKQIRYGGT